MIRFVATGRTTAVLLASGLVIASAHAQTPPPKATPTKPAAAPAATPTDGKTLSLGGAAAANGKLLTRDELRSCLQRQDTLASRRVEVEAARGPIEADKQALVADQETLKADSVKVDAARQSVTDLNTRYQAYGERVTKWNQRAEAVKDVITRAADRERAALETERGAIEKQKTQLDEERASIGVSAEKAVNDYNTRARALDARVVAWNQRNAELTERARTLNADRDGWANDCAGRNYREMDERIIKAGGK